MSWKPEEYLGWRSEVFGRTRAQNWAYESEAGGLALLWKQCTLRTTSPPRRLTTSVVLRRLSVLLKVFPSHLTVQAHESRYASRISAHQSRRQPFFFCSVLLDENLQLHRCDRGHCCLFMEDKWHFSSCIPACVCVLSSSRASNKVADHGQRNPGYVLAFPSPAGGVILFLCLTQSRVTTQWGVITS